MHSLIKYSVLLAAFTSMHLKLVF